MTIHIPAPEGTPASHDHFEVVLASAARIAVRQNTEGHVYVFAFNPAHTALATLTVQESPTARYVPAYFEEEAWRYADHEARRIGVLCPKRALA